MGKAILHKTWVYLIIALMVMLPIQASGAENFTPEEKAAPEAEEVPVRVEDPWTISMVALVDLGAKFRLGYHFGDESWGGKNEVAFSFNGVRANSPYSSSSKGDWKNAWGIGYRRYFSTSRFSTYAGANIYYLEDGVWFADDATILPSISAGIHWQAYMGFTFGMGLEIFNASGRKNRGDWELAINTELGWSF